MNKSRKITLKDGRRLVVLDCNTHIIIRCGCRCGHGLLINNGSYIGICSWYSEQYDLKHEFVDEVRDLLTSKKKMVIKIE